MKRKRHTEEQIIAILKEHEAGAKTADVCRKHGVSEATFYNWKAKYGGLEVSEAKRLLPVDRITESVPRVESRPRRRPELEGESGPHGKASGRRVISHSTG